MRPEERDALVDAAEKRRKDERFETSLARQVRNHGLGYDDYIRLITNLRELAEEKGTGLEDAAKHLASEEKEG